MSNTGKNNLHKNYIFSLYGTLLNIETDEMKRSLWKSMADMYAYYGVDYMPEEIRDAFHYLCKSEELRIRKTSDAVYSEVSLNTVFARLLTEAPHTHASAATPAGWDLQNLKYWTYHTAAMFRTLSVIYCHPYFDTINTLNSLKNAGCHLYLLANAQSCFAIPELETKGLYEYFDEIRISSDYQMRMPEKAFLEGLMKDNKLNKKDTVLVGSDFATDILTAKENGIESVYLNTYGLEKKQRTKEWNSVAGDSKYEPKVIVSGHIHELLDM